MSKIRIYKPSEMIIHENFDDKCMYSLISGSAQVEKEGGQLAEIDRSGDLFGEPGFVDEESRPVTIRAITDAVCLAADVPYLLMNKIKKDGKS